MSLTDFPTLVDTFTDPDDSAGDELNTPTKEHDAQHAKKNQALAATQRVTVGPTFENIKGHGAAGSGLGNDSAAFAAADAVSSDGAIWNLPPGEYPVDPGTMNLLSSRRVQGAGMDTSWIKLRSNTSNPAVYVNVPTPSGTVRGVYGPALRHVGINLSAAPSAIGVRIGQAGGAGITSGWTALDHVRIEGGTISVNNQATNVLITGCHFINPSSRFFTATDTGLEVVIDHTVLEVSPGVTVSKLIEVALATGGIKGALYLDHVRCNNAGTVNTGVEVSCPNGSTASMPLRAIGCIWDNLAGPGYNLINVTDAVISAGWVNSAGAGSHGAIRFYGGGNHVVMGQEQLNGGSGGSGCSYDFAGGDSGFIVLMGNRPSTGPVYRLPATNKPVNLLIQDLLASGLSIGNVTNDAAGLVAAMCKIWTPATLDYLLVSNHIQAGGPIRPGGYSTAGRPTPATYGNGAMIWDEDLGLPVWARGSTWIRADGVVV